ncbi:MAG: polyprenol monophosphomannose synthase [Pseudomonadales bacterium]
MMLLSVIIPTYNERDNIANLLQRLTQVLAYLSDRYEILVVDDESPDGTADVVLQGAYPAVRVLRRSGERDLSRALAQGFDVARGKFVLAMDADLQHDPLAIPALLQMAQRGVVDVVVASRYAVDGGVQGWGKWRLFLSLCATRCVRFYLPTKTSDPLSGFFLLRRTAWQEVRGKIQPDGFKLLLAILSTNASLQCEDVGYFFVARQRGCSKFGVKPVLAFLHTLWRLTRKAQ